MKKSILVLSLVLGLAIGATAQNGSGLFKRGDATEENTDRGFANNDRGPGLPWSGDHGQEGDGDAPLGSGALLLIGLGAAYAIGKKKKD